MRHSDHHDKVVTIGEDVVELLQTKLKALEFLDQLRLVSRDGTVWPVTGTQLCRKQIARVKLALKAFEDVE
tara:strand:+ start:397 stop:609 length:213 start_codon:yes stop_codon:yes gene_type:complete